MKILIYTLAILHAGPTSEANGNRKRKTDWSQIQHHGDFSIQLVDNGPMTKIPTQSKDRRKSQGKSHARTVVFSDILQKQEHSDNLKKKLI